MNKVKYYRLISGLLLKDLSEKTGLSVGHLSHIENGNKQPSKSAMESIALAGSGAASFDKSLAGSYVTTTGLYMRHGAGKNKRAMVLIPEGTKVQNYGYYTSYNGTKWLYIQVTLNGVQYTGFSSKTYLKKQ